MQFRLFFNFYAFIAVSILLLMLLLCVCVCSVPDSLCRTPGTASGASSTSSLFGSLASAGGQS